MPQKPNIPEGFGLTPFRLQDAEKAGLKRHHLRSSAYRRLFEDVYVLAAVPDSLDLRCDALALVLPSSAAFSHRTAARLYGLPVDDNSDCLHVIVPANVNVPQRRIGVRAHEGMELGQLRVHQGRRLTSPERTWLDLAGELDLVELVIVGDSMLRRGLTDRERLADVVAGAGRRRGVVLARRALPLLREKVDSPMETRLRLILVFAGLPCPEPNIDIFDDWGQWIARPDLQYAEWKIAIEYQGDHHRTDKYQWRDDIAMEAVMDDNGWALCKFTADDVFKRPQKIVQRISDKIAQRTGPGT